MKTAIIGVLLLPLVLLAQQNGEAWSNIGPSPAAVSAIAVDPRGSGTIFMSAIVGGVRKSIDGGATWSTVNTGLTNLHVVALAMDASGPQTVYAATVGGGLFKTADGGATWRNIPAISPLLESVAADPKLSGVVYAGVFNNAQVGSIRKSVDGGVTWATIFPTTAAIFNIAIDPRNSDVLYLPTVGRGAFKSTDGGQNWSPMSALTPRAIWTLVLDPANSQVLYAGTNEDGIWKSTDAGNTWRHAGSPGPFPVNSLIVDPSAALTIHAGTNGGGVWTSSDGGITWQATRLSSGMVWSLAVNSGALYAGTNAAGAQVSRDRGATWTVLPTGIDAANKFGYGIWIDPGNGRKMFVSSELPYGMVWSQNGGASWSVNEGFTGFGSRSVAFDPSDTRRIYAGGMIGSVFFKSTDGGMTWSTRRFGSPAVYVVAVAVDPLSPNIVYVGTQNEGLFKSTDYGDTWVSTGSGLSGAITYLTPDPIQSGRLFACTGMAFYLSEDSGETWTNVLNFPAWTVTIDPNTPSAVYATARTQGIFRSSDGGRTWRNINTGLTRLNMRQSAPVIIDPTNPETLYVGSLGGVFKSLDGGDHWFAVNSGLGELDVVGLAMDPENPAVLYASGPHGVYKTVTGAEVQSTPTISAVVNGASNLSGPVSPGEIVVINGFGLGPGQLIPAIPGADGLYRAQLSGTTVQFDGTSAPLIYTSAGQVAAQVPDSVSVGTTQLTVAYEGRTSASFPVQVNQYAPGVFTLDATGKGQAVALNQDDSVNTASKPAKTGDLISLFVTGTGDGPITISIGGTDGISTTVKPLSPGVVRIDARIPNAVQSGSATPVIIRVGGVASQPGVTVATVAAPPVQSQRYVISTYAGGGPPPSGIAAVNAPIASATAVAADGAGNIYFVSSLNCVFKVDPQGIITRVAGTSRAGYSGDGGPAVDAQLFTTDVPTEEEPQFGYPGGIVADGAGNLYISDTGNHRVRKVSTAGVITTVAGNGTSGYSGDGGLATGAQLFYPAGLALDSAGNLHIADFTHIRKVSPSGVITTVLTVESRVLGLAVDKSGDLYLAGGPHVRRVSPDGTITVVAGNGQIGFGGDGGPANSAQLIGPSSVVLDNSGNLYIADVSRVRKVSPDGIISSVAGVVSPGTTMPLSVESISLDNSGSLYIAGYSFVFKLPPNGVITAIAGNGGSPDYAGDGGQALHARLNAPSGVAVDASGNLYIADSGNGRVRKISPDGIITTVAGNGTSDYSGDGGPATAAGLPWPHGLAVDNEGNLYIGGGFRVRKVLADGTIHTVAGNGLPFGPGGSPVTGDGGPATAAQLTASRGLAVDAAGNLYILDFENNRVRKVGTDGIITTFAGTGTPGFSGDGGPATSAQLGFTKIHGPNPGLAFDLAGNLYIADVGNLRIRRVTPDGIITTVAGRGQTLGYSGDGGPATQAQMFFPTAIADDTDGNVFIGEATRVRKVSPDGIITTVVGSPLGISGYSGDGLDATSALIGFPSGLAVDSSGKVYIADPNHNVIRVLLPASSSGAAQPASVPKEDSRGTGGLR